MLKLLLMLLNLENGKQLNSQSSVRLADQNVAMTLKNSATAITDWRCIQVKKCGTLFLEHVSIRRNVDEVLVDVNIDGTVKSCSLGDASRHHLVQLFKIIGIAARLQQAKYWLRLFVKCQRQPIIL